MPLCIWDSWTTQGMSMGGWGEEYMQACRQSLDEIRRMVEAFEKDYTMIITADHGGHGWMHGTTEKEDMQIPLLCIGPDFCPGEKIKAAGICDIAPTITQLVGVPAEKEWKGRSLLPKILC